MLRISPIVVLLILTGLSDISARITRLEGFEADNIHVLDSSNNYTSDNMEGVLSEISDSTTTLGGLLVPYNGASSNVDMGTYTIDVPSITGVLYIEGQVNKQVRIKAQSHANILMETDGYGGIHYQHDGVSVYDYNPVSDSMEYGKPLIANETFYFNTSYAHGYASSHTVTTVASTSTFVILSPSWSATVAASGFSISGATCTYNGLGGSPKIFKVSGIFSADVDDNTVNVFWGLFKNGVLNISSLSHTYYANQLHTESIPFLDLISLETGDKLDMRVSADAATNVLHRELEFVIEQIN